MDLFLKLNSKTVSPYISMEEGEKVKAAIVDRLAATREVAWVSEDGDQFVVAKF